MVEVSNLATFAGAVTQVVEYLYNPGRHKRDTKGDTKGVGSLFVDTAESLRRVILKTLFAFAAFETQKGSGVFSLTQQKAYGASS